MGAASQFAKAYGNWTPEAVSFASTSWPSVQFFPFWNSNDTASERGKKDPPIVQKAQQATLQRGASSSS